MIQDDSDVHRGVAQQVDFEFWNFLAAANMALDSVWRLHRALDPLLVTQINHWEKLARPKLHVYLDI